MKIEIEIPDAVIDAIAAKVAAQIKPALMLLPESPSQVDNLMGVHEVARYLGTSKDWVYARTSRNEIPFVRTGRLVKFRRSDVDLWLSRQSVPDIASLSAPSPPGGRGIRNPVARQTDSGKRSLTGGMK